MPAADASPVASSESDLVKMDDRKRPASYDHNDSAPPLKKQATSVNGGSKPHPDADMPWKDDLEVSRPVSPRHSRLRRSDYWALVVSLLTGFFFAAVPKRCDMAPNAGVQTGESIPGNEAEGNVKSYYAS
jgi:hypothetical protein